MFETIVIAAARDRVEDAIRGAHAYHATQLDDDVMPTEPRVATTRRRLGQTLRRLSDWLDPMPPAHPTPATDAC